MIFSSSFSKFGKGTNPSAIMPSKDKIIIYYNDNGIRKKIVKIENDKLSLISEKVNLAYSEVCPISNYLVTRISKSLGIIKNE